MSQILSRKERRARKAHTCDICNAKIIQGESYIHSVWADGGRVFDGNQHIHCEAMSERYCMAMGVDEYDADDVGYWAQEEVCAECEKWADGCEYTALTCPDVLKALLPPMLLTHEDVRRHLEGGRNHG